MYKSLLTSLLLLQGYCSTAQALQQIPNADFSRWTGPEPTGWQSNNVYDDRGKLLRTLVEPAETAGAKLTVKRVVHREEAPAIVSFDGGMLTSRLVPFMPTAEKSVRLQVRYRFVPDSADILKADVLLDSRNNEPGRLTPDLTCDCQLKSPFGSGPVTLPAAGTSQTVTFDAVFTNPADPSAVPPGCPMYIWKIRFWIENKATHPHERTEAIIEQVQIRP